MFFEFGDDVVGNAIDAAHGRDNPNLVADADFTIGAFVTVEGEFAVGVLKRHLLWLPCVFERSRKVGLYVFVVSPRAFRKIGLGMSDRVAVFDEVLARLDILERELMSCWNVLEQGDVVALDVERFAFREVGDGDSDIVGRVDFDKFSVVHSV